MLKRVPGWLWALSPIILGLAIGYRYLVISVNDSYSENWSSSSSAVAKERGVLLRQYVVEPRQVKYLNYRIDFTDCWVEEQTKTEHDFLIFEKVTKLGRPRLVLKFRTQRLASSPDSVRSPMLVLRNGSGGQYLDESESPANPYLPAEHFLSSVPVKDGNNTLYLGLIRTWQDKPTYFIRVYPKT
jgi:hypothetical protein